MTRSEAAGATIARANKCELRASGAARQTGPFEAARAAGTHATHMLSRFASVAKLCGQVRDFARSPPTPPTSLSSIHFAHEPRGLLKLSPPLGAPILKRLKWSRALDSRPTPACKPARRLGPPAPIGAGAHSSTGRRRRLIDCPLPPLNARDLRAAWPRLPPMSPGRLDGHLSWAADALALQPGRRRART